MTQHEFEYLANADIFYSDRAHFDAFHPKGVVIRIAKPNKAGFVVLNIHAGLSQTELNDFVRAVAVLDGQK